MKSGTFSLRKSPPAPLSFVQSQVPLNDDQFELTDLPEDLNDRASRLTRNNVKRNDTWFDCFKREPPLAPTEIIPGLYLGNVKTAAAYLSGEIDPSKDSDYPPIGRVLTVMKKNIRYPTVPQDEEVVSNIKHKFVHSLDTADELLIRHFDEMTDYIHEGMREYYSDDYSDDTPDDIDDLVESLAELALDDEPLKSTTSEPSRPFGGVLVHCHAGKSRSASAVIAYLVKYQPALFAELIDPRKKYPSASSAAFMPAKATRLFDKHDGLRQTAVPFNGSVLLDRAIHLVVSKRCIIRPNTGFWAQLETYVCDGCRIRKPDGSLTDAFSILLDDMDAMD